jgi:2-polyprenyl-3-methyl-5-hydroxy-6-metoxy-1,4-benzoquinol methylase
MLTPSRRLKYFAESGIQYLREERRICPNCDSRDVLRVVERKWLVTALVECAACRLRYRIPTDVPGESAEFYEHEYTEGVTTLPPVDADLAGLLSSGFEGHSKDFGRYIDVLEALGIERGARILDFGCSWGYGSWQLRQRGFSVKSYDVSRTRLRFGQERLGIDIVDDIQSLQNIDVFFTAHVLEHVPRVSAVWQQALRILKPGGLFVAFTPNGSDAYRQISPRAYRLAWGKVHPNVLSDNFYERLFGPNVPYMLASFPYPLPAVREWSRAQTSILDMSGWEMVAVAIPHARSSRQDGSRP